jgi:hypothetical protein
MIKSQLNSVRKFGGSALLLVSMPMFSCQALADGVWSDYDAVPPVISTAGSGDKPNIMVILDNSNSMDEAPSGRAVGSDNAGSKSEIARIAVKNIIDTFGDSMRMGLMAYEQSGIVLQKLHDSQYDVSFDPANYDEDYVGIRDSSTKAKRIVNPTDTSNYIHYNVALPFYSGSSLGNAFCYSSTADFDNGGETTSGPWDTYACYKVKTGTSDSGTTGMSTFWFNSSFSPTDSDYAQGIFDFGTYLTWQYVGPTWFANSSPGGGTVHVGIADVDATQKSALEAKLATSQFSTATDTPLRNAGLTPIEGALEDAETYFSSFSSGNVCTSTINEYVVLVTDGLPSVSKTGTKLSDPDAAISDAAVAAADLLASGVKTFVVGFALPYGVDPTVLDQIAIAGGTERALIADDSATLNSTLNGIFRNIINRTSSGTGAAVLANNSRGDGAFYQALYIPKMEDSLGNEVSWVGVLNGLFFDRYGLLREDTNQNSEIDDYDTDKIVELFYDSTQGRTRASYFSSSDADFPTSLTQTSVVELDELKYLWSARDRLAAISDPLTQRTYTDDASTGRAIFTSVDGTELVDFNGVTPTDLAALEAAATAAETTMNTAYSDLESAELQLNSNRTSMNDAFDAVYDPAYSQAISNGMTESEAETIAKALAIADPDYQTANGVYENSILFHDLKLSEYQAALDAYNQATASVSQYDFQTYMGVTLTEAEKVIRWVRGEDGISGYRSRAFDWTGDGLTEVWRLGDIIQSTPEVVGPPAQRYDITNGDPTYAAFVDRYAHRRHMIYVGANDGMLHAFNGGFWNDGDFSYEVDDAFTSSTGTASVTAHPLGSELWAYVPKAALPHLQWLTSPTYAHTYYVDGEPTSYDVNIFDPDTDHPNGWGTILVVPMRLGGGLFSVDTDGDSVKETKLRSSISIFDISNPEVAPKLLAEISHEELGFTTSKPALMKARVPDSGGFSATSTDRWVLAFGSGPNILDSATVSSLETAKLFLFDLETLSFVNNYDPYEFSTYTESYIGDVTATNWNSDYIDDALYFAINKGIDLSTNTDNTERGRLQRMHLVSDGATFDEAAWIPVSPSTGTGTSVTFSTLIDFERTSLGAPQTVRDNNGRRWVYAGTGRLMVADDNVSNMQQRFYGVMEPVDSSGNETRATVSASTLEDVTDIRVWTTGAVDNDGNPFEIPSGTGIESFNQLEHAISTHRSGWYRDLDDSADSTGRNVNGSAYFRKLLFFTEYTPNDDQCAPEGTSKAYALYYKTGTAANFDVIGTEVDSDDSAELFVDEVDLGQGMASTPTIVNNSSGLLSDSNGSGTLAIQLGTGELETINFKVGGAVNGRESWREISLDGIDL